MKKRKDGRYLKVVTLNGKRHYIYGETAREVERKAIELTDRGEKERGKESFEDIALEWWEEAEDRLAYQSLKVYKPALYRIIDYFKGISIKDIYPRDVYRLIKYLAQQKFKKKTIKNHLTVLSQVLKFAVRNGDIPFNPCVDITIPNSVESGEKRNSASSSDEEKVKGSADVWLFPFLILHTGLRKGEALALRWCDIDLEKKIISVSRSIYYEGDRPNVKEPKTVNSIRIVPIVAPLLDELKKCSNKSAETYVFTDDPKGKKPLTARRYMTLMKHFHDETGTSCTAHQLRHSFATIAAEKGIPAKMVQEILGHKQISTTLDIYTDFREASVDTALAALNEAFSD